MVLHRIDPQPTPVVIDACERLDVARQVVSAVLDLYARRGFVPPWACFLAQENGQIVGTCGFAGPPVAGEAEIAYFTFPGQEGRGVAGRMAATLIRLTRQVAAAETFIAHTMPQESASTEILRRLGFECLGTIEHLEDGPVWKWRERPGRAHEPIQHRRFER
jgi:[ribosomal protein S5]-alanine N-acetyltransferase